MEFSHAVLYTLKKKKDEYADKAHHRYEAEGFLTLYVSGEKAPKHLLVVYPSEPTTANE